MMPEQHLPYRQKGKSFGYSDKYYSKDREDKRKEKERGQCFNGSSFIWHVVCSMKRNTESDTDTFCTDITSTRVRMGV